MMADKRQFGITDTTTNLLFFTIRCPCAGGDLKTYIQNRS